MEPLPGLSLGEIDVRPLRSEKGPRSLLKESASSASCNQHIDAARYLLHRSSTTPSRLIFGCHGFAKSNYDVLARFRSKCQPSRAPG
jgi:hypothetical protein